MNPVVNIIAIIVMVISCLTTALFVIFGIYELIMGPGDAKKLLKKLHIPLIYNQVLIIGFASLILAIAGYILIAKLSGEL